jgi:hypothetical protein
LKSRAISGKILEKQGQEINMRNEINFGQRGVRELRILVRGGS